MNFHLGSERGGTAQKSMDAKRFSLVYIIGTYPSLTTTFIDREVNEMRRQGVSVRVISIRQPHTILSAEQEQLQGITNYLIPVSWSGFILAHMRFAFRKPAAYFGTLSKLFTSPHPDFAARLKTILHFAEGVYAAEVISKQPCDHIHAHFADRASTVALVAGKLLDVPYSLTAHANDIYIKPVLLPLKLLRAKFVSTCTAYNWEHLAQQVHLNGNLHCIHHGLDLESYNPVSNSSDIPQIMAVGQLKEKKGFQYLLDACAVLKSKGYSFHCQIIGEGPLHSTLERQIHDLGLEAHVTLRGALPHEAVIHEYQRSTLFVLPCVMGSNGDRDGIPNVILEAMAMHLPVISTRHSGIPEVVADGVNGLLVPTADVPSLASAIARLLDDPTLRSQMGLRGRQTVAEQFDVSRNTTRLLEKMIAL
jgi:colanic acid/amylovoran biosynthesis glycosyltransferase